MRAKNTARGGRKSSTSSSSAPSQRFQLGDLVICRYSTYPYWPATIDQTHQVRHKGAHVLKRRTRRGDKVLAYWCTFSNEDTGGWVRHDRITRYHPDIVPKIRLDEADEFFDDQAEALKVAQRAYAALPVSGRSAKPPARLPKDFSAHVAVNSDDEDMLQSDGEEGDDDQDDDDDDDGDGEEPDEDTKEKTPPRPANSRVRRRGTGRPSTKRNGASTTASAAPVVQESDDEMDLGDDSDDDPKDGADDVDSPEKEATKSASRKITKRARLSTSTQLGRRSSTTTPEKPKPSTGRAARTSLTPKKEPRRTSTKRKPPTPAVAPRERKRPKSSSQNSIPLASSKPTALDLEDGEAVLEIPVPNDESPHAPPEVEKVLGSDKSSDSEQDDDSSPQKQSPSKSATNESPSSSKRLPAGKKLAGATKDPSKGSVSKPIEAESKTQEKSSASGEKAGSSYIADETVSKSEKKVSNLDEKKLLSNSSKEVNESSIGKDEATSTPATKSDEPKIIAGIDHGETLGKTSHGQIIIPKKGISSDAKVSGVASNQNERSDTDKDGDSVMKEIADSTVKIDIVKNSDEPDQSKGEPVKVKIVEEGLEPESDKTSKNKEGVDSAIASDVKKDKGDNDLSNNVKTSKDSSRGGSVQKNEPPGSQGKVSRDKDKSSKSLPSAGAASVERSSGATSEKNPALVEEEKSTGTLKEDSASKSEGSDVPVAVSKAGDGPRKSKKESGFVKIDVASKSREGEKSGSLPQVKVLNSSADSGSTKKPERKPSEAGTSVSRDSQTSERSKRAEAQKAQPRTASEPVPKMENSLKKEAEDADRIKGGLKHSTSSKSTAGKDLAKTSDGGRNEDAGNRGATEKSGMVDESKRTAEISSHALRPTTGAKQPIMVKIAPSKATLSGEAGNGGPQGSNSESTEKREISKGETSQSEKLKPPGETEKLIKMSENSAIQAGIAADGMQEDDPQDSQGDIGSTVKRNASGDTAEMDVVSEKPAKTVEGLTNQLERARLTIGKLRSRLEALDELHGSKEGETNALATFVMPIAPDNLQLDLPNPELYMSVPVDADRFVEVVQHIRKTFDSFKTRVKAAEFARNELQTQAIELRKRYEEKCESVLKAEEEAVMEERELVDVLQKLLIYKANATELKKHKAGNLVRSIGKTCKQMPAVANICEEIYVTWRSHFIRHLVSSSEKVREGEHEPDGTELKRRDGSEKPVVGEEVKVESTVKVEVKTLAVKEDKGVDSKGKEEKDEEMDKGNEGNNDEEDENDENRESGDVVMDDGDDNNADDANMADDESGDDDDDDASEKKSRDMDDGDDEDDLE